MAKKTKTPPSSSKSQSDEPTSKKQKKPKKTKKQVIIEQEYNTKENQESQQNSQDLSQDVATKRETLKELLQPFSKDQIIEFLKFAVFEDKELLPRITQFSDSDPAHRKVFVHGLSWDTTSEQVLSVFDQFGDIEECNVPVDKASGRAKGFAFVLYRTREAAENALKERQKKIGNKAIFCRLSSDGPVGANSGVEESGRKIFVANVAPHVDPEMIRVFFEQFGELEEGPSGMDPVTRKFRGYCLFVYKSSEGCKKALEEPVKMFENCRLECRLATDSSRNVKNQTRGLDNVGAGFGGSPSIDIGGNVNYNVGVNAGFYANPAGMGHNSGYRLANPMMVPSLNQNGLATPIGANSGVEDGGRKIFVANVAPHVDPEMIKLFFEKFGELEEGPSGTDPLTGKFRGFCFFVYKSSEGCKKALEEPVKMFQDCRLECRLATENFKNIKNQRGLNNVGAGYGGSPISDIGGNVNYNIGVNPGFYAGHNSGYESANPIMVPSLNQNGLATPIGANLGVEDSCRKIFVANVAPHVNPEMIKLFFEKFGELEEGPSGMDSVTGKFRGFCFFIYKSSEGCKKALEEPVKMFENCRLECRLATENFRNIKNQTRGLNNVGVGLGGSLSSDVGGNVNYNVGVNPGFYANPAGMGHNLGFGLANPMIPSLNQNGLATPSGTIPQTFGFGGNFGINSVSPGAIANYGSLHGLGYQAQVGNSSAGSTMGQSAGHWSHLHL